MTERELLDLLARDVAEALTAIADREGCWAGVTRSFASSIYARHARPVEPPTPPADADDAGARLVAWLVERDAPVLVDLALAVIRERDEARRKCEDAMADALHAHTARLAAERDRDEAQQAVTDAMQREGHAKAQYFEARDRAAAAEATVRELRALCEEAADHITPTAYVHMAKLAARLRAAAAGEEATHAR